MKNSYLPLLRCMVWCGFWMIALLVVLAGCGGGSSTATSTSSPTVVSTATTGTTVTPSVPSPTLTQPAPTTVNASIIKNGGYAFTFSPLTLNITVGTTVIWTNSSTASHTVTSDSSVFDSGMISPGGTYHFKFTQAGTFTYHCNIHPYMMATIIVK